MPTYYISDQNEHCARKNQNDDKSFKSCVCLLLIFITLCMVLFLASILLQKSKNKIPQENDDVEYLENNKLQVALSSNEKMIENATERILEKEQEATTGITVEDNDKRTTPKHLVITTTTTTESNVHVFTTQPSISNEDETPYSFENPSTTRTFEEDSLKITTTPSFIASTFDTEKTTLPEAETVTTVEVTENITTETIELNASSTEKILEELGPTATDDITTEAETKINFDTTSITTTDTNDGQIITTTNTITESTQTVKEEVIDTTTPFILTSSTTPMPKTTTSSIPEMLPTAQSTQTVKEEAIDTTTSFILTSSTTPMPKTTTSSIPEMLPIAQSQHMVPTLTPSCSSTRCKSIASSILYRLDPAQDPCEDFYGFACGGPEATMIEDDSTRNQLVAKVIFKEIAKIKVAEKSKGVEGMVKYYGACVKEGFEGTYEGRLEKVRGMLKSMNLHQFLLPNDEEGFVDLTTLFEKMILMQLLPVFDITVGVGFETGNDFRLELTPPSLYASAAIFLDEDMYTNGEPASAQMLLLRRRCFADLADRVAKINGQPDLVFIRPNGSSLYAGRQDRIECVRRYRAGPFADRVVNVSGTLLQGPVVDFRGDLVTILDDIDKLFINADSADLSPMHKSVYELEIEFPFIKWVELFNKLTSKTFNQHTRVYLQHPKLLVKMFAYLRTLPSYKIHNAFVALFSTDLYMNLVEPQAKKMSLRTHCQMETVSLFPHISSALYIKSIRLSDQEAMDEYLEDIFTQLKKNLTGSLQGADWMDERSKTACVSTLDELNLYLANDDLCLGEEEINEMYKNFNISECYEQNFVDMVSLKRKLRFELFGNEFKAQYINGFFMNSYDVEPTSIFSENIIAIPVGMVDIHNPIGMPRFLIMANIGIHVAIELGKRFGPVGIVHPVMISSKSAPSYDAFKQSATDQFSYTIDRAINKHNIKFQIKSELSLNSRISDSTGFRMIMDAFDSYQELLTLPWLNDIYSNEQIYMIAALQGFCRKKTVTQYLFEMYESDRLSPSLRVENMVTNSHAFASAFKCREGAKMNCPIKLQFPYIEAVEGQDYPFEYNFV